jgi:cation diffusion facilitator CzcD-associated flavoprotein CzcO
MAPEHVDVLIVGAGISGVGGACRQAGVATQIDVRV